MYAQLSWAIEPLANHERNCVENGRRGDLEPICGVIEHGSLAAYQEGLSSPRSVSLASASNSASERLAAIGMLNSSQSVITRLYGGVYFSYSQAVMLDALASFAHSAPAGQRDTLLAILLSTASEIVNTVGKQFAQPLRPRSKDGTPKSQLLAAVERDRAIDVLERYDLWTTKYGHRVVDDKSHAAICCDYADALDLHGNQFSVIYADHTRHTNKTMAPIRGWFR
jgi:hypothetical protein